MTASETGITRCPENPFLWWWCNNDACASWHHRNAMNAYSSLAIPYQAMYVERLAV